ncbi:hypothetical protein AAW14_06575 [Streptomyces hygroscopicus]|uniref:hypothetical protein n=1 Tax=Streptomyces hygroscopicus TaxID=1912 RepID=UPI00223F97A7|nr:hypothetical protein [Streptomyces hygroscopicus]MCW7941700.1 hypothetical protein [Streptomyces hygroscopicus]
MTTRAAAMQAAASIRRAAQKTAAADPVAHGSDWRLATVSTVNTDGTIVTSDGITVRRLKSYPVPSVGDQVMLAWSGLGNWMVIGQPSAGTTWAWQTMTGLAAGANSSQNPGYRLTDDAMVEFRGSWTFTNAPVNPFTLTTLPTGYRPSNVREFGIWSPSTGTAIQCQVATTGVVTVYSTNKSYWLDNTRFSL